MPEPKIHLPTDSGYIELHEARDAGDCISCDRSGGGMARVSVAHTDKVYRVCGNCIGGALAVQFRNAAGRPGSGGRPLRGS